MNILNKIRPIARIFPNLYLCPFLLVLILVFTSCKKKPETYSILEFNGTESVWNYSKSLYMFSHTPDSVNPAALLASEGDLIIYGEEFFVYTKPMGNKFSFFASEDGGYVNGKITTLNIRKSDNMLQWFEQIKAADLSQLEFIKIDTIIPENYYPYLADLAKIKPGLGLIYDSDIRDISRIIKLFNPRYLVGPVVYGRDFDLLSGLSNLEILVAGLADSVYTAPLPALPALRHLLLNKISDKVVLDDKFLSGNRSLEKITVVESKIIDFSFLKPLVNLKELVITNFDTIENFDLINSHTSIEVLSIIGEGSVYKPVKKDLPGIRWMTFSPEVTQDAFDSFIYNHPHLEVAEILKNDTITSLGSLLKLRDLIGLTVTDTLTDMPSVKSLKNLKYLSLPLSLMKDESVRGELKKLLPGTTIVANEGFCLGSGWLLLLVPLVMAFSILSGKKLGKAHDQL
jgi:hypothetical protein